MWKRVNSLLNWDISNCVQYISELRSNPRNLLSVVYIVLASDVCLRLDLIPTMPTLGIRMDQNIHDSEINLNSIAMNSTPYTSPWLLKPPRFNLSMHLLGNKLEVSPTVFQSKFNELLSHYDGYTHIFTDRSKIGETVGNAAIVASRVCKKCLPNNSSIFSAED